MSAAIGTDLSSVRSEELRRGWTRLKRSPLSIVGLVIVALVVLAAVFAPVLAPYPQDAGPGVHFDRVHKPPSLAHLFGTDDVGRDIFSRSLFGARLSLGLGMIVLAIGMGIGIPLGLIAGYWGRGVATLIMRTADIFLAIPSLVLALAVAAAFKPTLTTTMIAISFSWWPWFTRLVYGEALRIKENQFVESSRGLGASSWRTAYHEILPNLISPIIVKATLDMGFVIMMDASLSFLGLGAQPPTPAWGTMIAEGRQYLPTIWWQATMPGLMILVTVMGFNLLGDGFRDLLDVHADIGEG